MTMNRLVIDSVAQIFRGQILTACANGMDDDLPPEDRPDRAEVVVGSFLKIFDHVRMHDDTECVVIAPGRGSGYFSGWHVDSDGQNVLGMYAGIDVIDRAPADPNETPMPIFPEPEEPEEEPEP